MAIETGSLIAKHYRVTGRLGKGGMGEVFSADNIRTGRGVALKVLRAESKTKKSAIERFRREARAAGSIQSPYVTEVIDVDDDDEHGIVLVFELLRGESLVERLKRTGPIPFAELWGIVEAVWMGLADAHAVGIIHRDLKPSNVFLEERRNQLRVKILDFGISKLPKNIGGDTLTRVGQSLGTFSFMPPEQIGRARNVDHRADIYACATLIYQAMSGKLPYRAKNVVAMMELKSKTEPRSLAEVMRSQVPIALESFIGRGLARNPDDRYQTAVEALASWRKIRPQGARSIMEADAAIYPDPVDDEPSYSDEMQTTVLDRDRVEQAAAVAMQAIKAQRSAARPEATKPVAPTRPLPKDPPKAPAQVAGIERSTRAQQPPPPARPAAKNNLAAIYLTIPARPAQPASPAPAAAGQHVPAAMRQTKSAGQGRPVGPTVGLIFAALGFMVLGFLTVALILRLLEM